MGEFADMAVDDALNGVHWIDEDDPDWEGDGSPFHMGMGRRRKLPSCRYCGKKNLTWKHIPSGWRLHDIEWEGPVEDGKSEWVLHTCSYKGAFRGLSR